MERGPQPPLSVPMWLVMPITEPTSPFLQLPVEIRHMIYELLFPTQADGHHHVQISPRCSGVSSSESSPQCAMVYRFPVAILQTNKQIFNEASSFLYGRLKVTSGAARTNECHKEPRALVDFLELIGPRNAALIPALDVHILVKTRGAMRSRGGAIQVDEKAARGHAALALDEIRQRCDSIKKLRIWFSPWDGNASGSFDWTFHDNMVAFLDDDLSTDPIPALEGHLASPVAPRWFEGQDQVELWGMGFEVTWNVPSHCLWSWNDGLGGEPETGKSADWSPGTSHQSRFGGELDFD